MHSNSNTNVKIHGAVVKSTQCPYCEQKTKRPHSGVCPFSSISAMKDSTELWAVLLVAFCSLQIVDTFSVALPISLPTSRPVQAVFVHYPRSPRHSILNSYRMALAIPRRVAELSPGQKEIENVGIGHGGQTILATTNVRPRKFDMGFSFSVSGLHFAHQLGVAKTLKEQGYIQRGTPMVGPMILRSALLVSFLSHIRDFNQTKACAYASKP